MRALVFAAFLMINPTCTEATGDMNYCYILDGILILYGIILTILYCQLRKKPAEGGIYAGLTTKSSDVYETIKTDKKPVF
ncbi:Fc receptor%2C IgE, high affinity I, gamma polypeptide like [Xyrichtys novacula]|uniref:Fc receptor, IgE, high affinity I, gamma polypeptide like n=1 Tax=Xyrichtys novacula TaxID=13765 RepID=A0AAV1GL23_XYRNO|nr:Fc receptor%2C IgE, high affinity I, gamma polypeptide like [Xyrichtys novacula]